MSQRKKNERDQLQNIPWKLKITTDLYPKNKSCKKLIFRPENTMQGMQLNTCMEGTSGPENDTGGICEI